MGGQCSDQRSGPTHLPSSLQSRRRCLQSRLPGRREALAVVGRSPPPGKREGEAGRSLISPGAAEGSLLLQASAPPCSPAHTARPGPGNVSWCAVCSTKVSPAGLEESWECQGKPGENPGRSTFSTTEGSLRASSVGEGFQLHVPGAPDSCPLPLPFPFLPLLGSSAAAAYFKMSPGYLRKLERKDGGDLLHTPTRTASAGSGRLRGNRCDPRDGRR